MRDKQLEPLSQAVVVGHNLDAQRFLLSVARFSPQTSLRWFRTAQDADFELRAKEFGQPWLLTSSAWSEDVGARTYSLSHHQAFLFYSHLKRLPLADFMNGAHRSLGMHAAIARKIVAIGLAQDLTPHPMGDHQSKYSTPDVFWSEKSPLSHAAMDASIHLLPRWDCLAQSFVDLSALRVEVVNDSRIVTGLRPSLHRGDDHQLVHNAPFEATSAQRILWTGMGAPLGDHEGLSPLSQGRSPMELPVARWRTLCAKVPFEHVLALPQFSLWIDPLYSKDFLETGRVRSGFLKRVFCIPDRQNERAWLQMDVFEWLGESVSDGGTPLASPWLLLKALCPHLHVTEEMEFSLDENFMFRDPKARFTRVSRDIDYWFAGFLGDPAQVRGQWVQRRKVEKSRTPLSPGHSA